MIDLGLAAAVQLCKAPLLETGVGFAVLGQQDIDKAAYTKTLAQDRGVQISLSGRADAVGLVAIGVIQFRSRYVIREGGLAWAQALRHLVNVQRNGKAHSMQELQHFGIELGPGIVELIKAVERQDGAIYRVGRHIIDVDPRLSNNVGTYDVRAIEERASDTRAMRDIVGNHVDVDVRGFVSKSFQQRSTPDDKIVGSRCDQGQ
ncbi:hypothetical protein CFI11_00215 [Thalassococcus sp. S3]|nr:hypothetical protein CFI11_00215 [Thalassococcus sp. S3]